MILRPMYLILTTLTILGFLHSTGMASDWPRFRGENGTGVVADKDVPVEFGPTKNLVWKVPIAGVGNSSPIVWKQRVYLQTATADGKERLMLCLSLRDGKVLWQKSAPGSTAKTHAKSSLASGSAATDGERVYMPFWDGTRLSITAFDLEGKIVWTHDLGPFKSQHGAGHSPIVHAGKVIIANDQDDFAEIVALDAATGNVAWKSPRKAFKASYSTPVLLERNGESDVVVVSTAGAAGLDPASGSERWRWNWTTNDLQLRTVGSPVMTQGMIFFGGGNGPGDRHSVGVRLEGKGELPAENMEWQTRKLLPYVPSMLPHGEHVFFVNDKGIAGCFAAKTGTVLWSNRVGDADVTASPLLIDGKIYVINEKGSAFVFAADTKEFKLLSSCELDEVVRASPAVADNRLLIRGREHLFCFGKPVAVSAR